MTNRTTTVYDDAGRTIRTVNPLDNIVTSGYDAAGRKTLRIDARGNRTTYTYDAASRVEQRLYPNATRITWTYDANGNPTSVDQADGNWTRSFDDLNRVVEVTQPNAGTLTFSYDAAGRRDYMIDTEGGTTTYSYDDAGRIKTLVNPDGDRTTYSYDAAGRRTVKHLANETRASYTYDNASRVTFLGNLKSNNEVISSFDYAYDAAGNRTNVVEADGDRVTWTYDATYQLTAEHRSGLDAYAHTFAYDPVGNRLTKAEDGDVTTYTYNAANQLTVSRDAAAERVTYTYDVDGNQRSVEEPSGDITTQTWSYENKLIQIERPLDEVVTYTYSLVKRDNTEQRVSKDDDTTFVRFVWDDERIIAELDDVGSSEAEYTLEPAAYGNLISQSRESEQSYYHYDALGSTRALTDDGEVQTDEYSYYAFGKQATTSGATENNYQWVGELGYYLDAESGLNQLRGRPQRPETGRFVSQDPVRDDEENLYRYVGNNPVNFVDPSGLAPNTGLEELLNCTTGDAAIDSHIIKICAALTRQGQGARNIIRQRMGRICDKLLDGTIPEPRRMLVQVQRCLAKCVAKRRGEVVASSLKVLREEFNACWQQLPIDVPIAPDPPPAPVAPPTTPKPAPETPMPVCPPEESMPKTEPPKQRCSLKKGEVNEILGCAGKAHSGANINLLVGQPRVNSTSDCISEILKQVFSIEAIQGVVNKVKEGVKELVKLIPGGSQLLKAKDVIEAIIDLLEGETEKSADQLKDEIKKLITPQLPGIPGDAVDQLVDNLYEFAKAELKGCCASTTLSWKNKGATKLADGTPLGSHSASCDLLVCKTSDGWSVTGCCEYRCKGSEKQCVCKSSLSFCFSQVGSGAAGSCKAGAPKIRT